MPCDECGCDFTQGDMDVRQTEIKRLRATNAELEQAVRALLEVVDPIHGPTIRVGLDALSRSAAEATATPARPDAEPWPQHEHDQQPKPAPRRPARPRSA